MPKETFEGWRPNDESAQPIGVTVSWGKAAQWVQVATINMSRNDETEGWCAELDRRTINKLIRVLRRARDQADPDGRDE